MCKTNILLSRQEETKYNIVQTVLTSLHPNCPRQSFSIVAALSVLVRPVPECAVCFVVLSITIGLAICSVRAWRRAADRKAREALGNMFSTKNASCCCEGSGLG
uniref:Uncharacterized protein n=1 Tax=Odontella aurita TaxID=265563 RepID=A0A7S4J0I9_9STRA